MSTLNIGGQFVVNGGTLDSASGTLNINDITIGAGTLNSPNFGGELNVAGNWSKTGGTFSPGTGTVAFTSAGTQLINTGGAAFNNVSHAGAGTLQVVTSDLNVNGALSNDGTLDLNGKNLSVGGAVANAGTVLLQGVESVTLSAGNDVSKGAWKYVGRNVAETLVVKDFGGADYFNLSVIDTHANKATFVVGSGTTSAVAGTLAVSSGTLDASGGSVAAGNVVLSGGTLVAPTSGSFSASGDWNKTGGTFSAGAGTVAFTGSGVQTVNGGGAAFNNVTHSGAGTLKVVTGGLAVGGTLANSAGTVDINGFTVPVGGLVLSAGLVSDTNATKGKILNAGTFDVRSGAIGAVLDGGAGLTKTTAGTVTLDGANTYFGATQVNSGRLVVNGSTAAGSAVSVAGGAVLAGTGVVGGTVNNAGTLAPGSSPGVLTAGDFSFATGSTFEVEIGGTTAGNTSANHDQLVAANVTIGSGVVLSLATFGGFVPNGGEVFRILDNTGSNAVSGTFSGLGEGAVVAKDFLGSGLPAHISYVGGAGNNDVVIVVSLPEVTVTRNVASLDEGDGAGVVYTFSRTGVAAGPLTVSFLSSGTAVLGAGADFLQSGADAFGAFGGTVTIGAGFGSKTITVTRLEGNEKINLTFAGTLSSSLAGYTVGSPAVATAVIEDNETGVVDFQADQSNAESVDPTVRAVLSITGIGSGTVGLDVPLSVTATNAFSGTANGADLSAPFGTRVLTFAVGDGAAISSSSATLDVKDDRRLEGDEAVDLTFVGTLSSSLDGRVSEGDVTHTATIVDNETGVVDFQADQINAESVDPTVWAVLTITPNGSGTIGLDKPLSVTATNAFTGTTNAADLNTPFGSQVLAFAVGDGSSINSSSATLDVNDDRRLEGDETVGLTFAGTLSSSLNGQVSEGDVTHTATIVDNETGVVDFQADQSNAESVDPTVRAVLTITPIGSGTIGLDKALSVTATNAGTGTTNAADLSTPFGSQVLAFAVGDGTAINSSIATLDVNDDRRLEGNETVNLTFAGTLSSSLNGQVSEGDVTHTATIVDNETGMVDFQADQSNAESVDPTVRAVLTIAPIGSGTIGLDKPLSVTATNAFSGSANAADLSAAFGSQVLTFAVGDGSSINSSSATLDVNDDRRLEGDETIDLTFVGTLSSSLNGQVSEGDVTHTATIVDNETGMVDFEADQSNAESVDPTVRAVLSITAIGSGIVGLDVPLSVTATNALSGNANAADLSVAFGAHALAFSVGDGSAINSSSVTLDVNDDRRLEGDETVNLTFAGTLSSSLNGQVTEGDTSHAVTIEDNEMGSIAFEADKSVSEGAGTTTLKATLTIAGIGSGTIGLDRNLTVLADNAAGGSASGGGVDYSFTATQLTFASGDGAAIDSTAATVSIFDDLQFEGSETANFAIGSLSTNLDGQVSITDNSHTLTIAENDTPGSRVFQFQLPMAGDFTIRRVGDNIQIFQGTNPTPLTSEPFANDYSVTIVGTAGNDRLTVDLTGNADAITDLGLTFNGLGETGVPGDSLRIIGGDQGDVTYSFTSPHDGSVVMSEFGTVNYTGLEPITNSGAATNVVFNLPAASAATLEDDGTVGNGLSRLRAPTIETVDFSNPSGNVTIHAGSTASTLTINSVPDLTAGLTFGGVGDEFGSVTVAGVVTLAANHGLSANAIGTIDLTTASSDVVVSGSGAVTLTTTRNISLASGASIATVNGGLTLLANQGMPTAGSFVGIDVSGAALSSGGSGAIVLAGRGGNGLAGQDGVRLTNGGAITTTGSGTLQITGTTAAADPMTGVALRLGGGLPTVVTLAGAVNTLVGDSMVIDPTSFTLNAGANAVTLRQNTNGTAIDVGGADASGVLGLANEELNRITAGTIHIGNANSGALTVSGAVTRVAATNLNFTSGSVITVNQPVAAAGGTTTLTAATINLNANIVDAVTGSAATAVNVNAGAVFDANPGQIQDGINVVASGGTVTVAANNGGLDRIYNESPAIDRPLSLVGPNVGVTAGSHALPEARVTGLVGIASAGVVVIDGFALDAGVKATVSGGDVTIANSIVTAASGSTVDISGVHSANIYGNNIANTATSGTHDGIHGQTITGGVTIQSNLVTGDNGVWLSGVVGNVQIGGTGLGEGNAIASSPGGNAGVVILSQGVAGVVNVVGNTINAHGAGIDFEDAAGNLTVRGNTIINQTVAGIQVKNSTSSLIEIGGPDALTDGNSITVTSAGFGISASGNTGALSVRGNNIASPGNGVDVTSQGGALTVAGNQITSDSTSIRAQHVAGSVAVRANELQGTTAAWGIDLSDVGTGVAATVVVGGPNSGDGNSLSVPLTGIAVGDSPNLTVQNNTLSNTSQGLHIYTTPAHSSSAGVLGNSITSGPTGTGIIFDGTVAVTLGPDNTISGGSTGLAVNGPGVSLVGNTLNNLGIAGQSGNYIELKNGALAGLEINGTAATFGSPLVGIAQGYAIEDKIVHAIDDVTVGFIRVQTGHLYVTPNSFVGMGSANIQRAVNQAVNLDTLHIQAGSYTGNVDATATGKNVAIMLSPGVTTGQVVNNGDVKLDGNDTLLLEISGTSNTSDVAGFDNFKINGAVNLGGSTLGASLIGGFVPSTSLPDRFVILDNDGADAIGGIFNGVNEGQVVTISGKLFQVTYQGVPGAPTDHNDVVVTAINATDPTLDGTPGDDTFVVVRGSATNPNYGSNLVASDVYIYLNGNLIWETPFAALSRLSFKGWAGSDSLVADVSNGDVVPGTTVTPNSGLQFDGGIPSGTTGDNLTITGSQNQGTTTYDFTSSHSGSVMLSNFGTVYFTADESVLNRGVTDNMVVNLPATASDATLGDDGIAHNDRSRISAATIVPVDFTTPNNLLTINAGTASDTLTISSPNDFTAGLTVGTSATPLATINVNSGLSLNTGTAALDLEAGTINLAPTSPIITTNGQLYGGAVALGSNPNLSSLGNIVFTSTINADHADTADRALTVSAVGSVTFGGSIGTAANEALADLDVGSVAGTINLNGVVINVNDGNAAAQTATFRGAVVLGTNVTISTDRAGVSDSSVDFSKTIVGVATIEGAHSLTVTAGSGAASFGDVVGGTAPLTDLDVSAATINLGGNVNSDGGSVTFAGNTVLTSGSLTIDTESGNDSDAGSVVFSVGSISATVANLDLTVNTRPENVNKLSGLVTLAAVDSLAGNAIRHLTVDASNPNTTATANKFNAGDINFAGPVALAVGGNLDARGGTILLSTSNSDLAVSGTGAISLLATQNIALSAGSSVVTVNGGLTLLANMSGAAKGSFTGVDIDNGLVQAIGVGAVSITGQGGDDAAGSQFGIQVRGGGAIVGGSGGSVVVQGTGGTGTGNANVGVAVTGTGSTISSGGGDVRVTGVEGSGALAIAISVLDSGKITTAVNGGAVTLIGNSMTFDATATISAAASASVSLRQNHAGVEIDLGTIADVIGGPLGISAAELTRVTAGTINIGNSSTGNVRVGDAIVRAAATNLNVTAGLNKNIAFSGVGSLNAAGGNVTLLTNGTGTGAIVGGGATTDVSGASVSLTAGSGGIGASGNPLAINGNTLVTNTQAGNGPQFVAEFDSVTIGSADLNAGNATITLAGGTFFTTASGSILSNTIVGSGATLAGDGEVTGTVTAQGGGHVSPGGVPGVLSTGSATFDTGASFDVDVTSGGLAAPIAGVDFDQLRVNGDVSLAGSLLKVTLGFSVDPSVLKSFTILRNDGSSLVTGTFAGLPEGSPVVDAAHPAFGTLYITYRGGDGNDVVLNTQAIINGTPGDDTFLLTGNGTSFSLVVNGAPPLVYANPYNITINGREGDDTLTVDFVSGQAIPLHGAFYNGNEQATIGDRIRVVGTQQETATYLPNGVVNSSLDNDGMVTVDGREIQFTTVEPLDLENMLNANVNFPNGNDEVTLANGTTFVTGENAIRVFGASGGVSFETVALRNNVNVNIDTSTSDGNDTITLSSATLSHGNANLSIDTGDGMDQIEVDGTISFSTGTVALVSQRIDFNSLGKVKALSQVTLDAGAGAITEATPLTPSVETATLVASASGNIDLGTKVGFITANTNVSGSVITLTESDDVTLTQVTTVNGAIGVSAGGTVTAEDVAAGSGNITIAVTGGDIVSGTGDADVADIVGNEVKLQLDTAGHNVGISNTNRLEINANQLQVVTTGNGNNANVLDTTGGLAVTDSGLGMSSSFDLFVAGGNLTSVGGGPADLRADTLVLKVTGTGNTIGASGAAPLEVDAATSVTATTDGGNIYLSDLAGDLPLGLMDAGGGNVDLAATVGAITHAAGSGNNITAAGAALHAISGIGTAVSPLQTEISMLAAVNSTAGDIRIDNGSAAGLTIGMVNGLADVMNSAASGQVVLTTATNFDLPSGRRIAAGSAISVASTNTSSGSTFEVHGDLDAVGATLTGSANASAVHGDSFNITPDDDTPITVHGLTPTVLPGDLLNLDVVSLVSRTLTLGSAVGSGTWTFSGAASLTYDGIERINANAAFDLVLDMKIAGYQNGSADTIAAGLESATGDLVLSVNGGEQFRSNASIVRSLSVIGSSDADTLQFTETSGPSGGLPKFLGVAPAFNNTGIGGGTSNGSHASTTTAALIHDVNSTLNINVSNVTIHFDGGAGSNVITTSYTTSHTVQYASDAANSGTLAVLDGSGPLATLQSLLSFDNVQSLNAFGAGGQFVADASSAPAAAKVITIGDGAASGDQVTQITPTAGSSFVTTNFGGFGELVVRSGLGADTIDLATLDSASTLTAVTLDGDSFTNSDTANDILQVESTAGLSTGIRLLGGKGNDSFNIVQSGGRSIAGIGGPVLVGPITGPGLLDDADTSFTDTLTVSDVGKTSGNIVVITNSTIEGLTGYAGGTDVTYANIDSLNVTGAGGSVSANDVFTIALDASELKNVTVNGSGGNDTFYLDLNTLNHNLNNVAGLTIVTLNGDEGNDTFGNSPTAPAAAFPASLTMPMLVDATHGLIEPSTTTAIVLNGGAAAAAGTGNATAGNVAGDTVNLDFSSANGAATAAVVSTVGGVGITTGYQNISFSSTEAVNVIDVLDTTPVLARVAMGDLFVRGTTGDDIIQFGATITPNVASTRVNTSVFNLAVTNKTVVFGRDGADTIQQSSLPKSAEFYGGPGDDYLSGATAADYLVGGLGADRLLGNNGANELWGDDLGDTTLIIGGNDIINGGTGADRIYGGGGNDSITAGAGNDYVFGGAGNDTIDGGADDDRLYGGDGDDVISGNTGDDLLAGNGGADRLYGQAGKDVLIGGVGADYMTGDDGNDLLFDGLVTATDLSSNVGSDASLLINDPNDLAMAQLLADWKAGNYAHLLTHPHDTDSDTLSGGLATDTSSKGANDTGDSENGF